MPRVTHWSQLTIGLVAGVAIIALVASVLLFARIGALHGDTVKLYTVTDGASGVIKGTEVWLGGQKIGLVNRVSLRPPSVDTTERVAMEMDVLSQYLRYIRHDSDIRIQPGGSLIGAPVVFITVGTARTAAVKEGDTLHARAQLERKPRIANVASFADSINAMLHEFGNVRDAFGVTATRATAARERSEQQIGEVENAIGAIQRRATRSNGTVALALSDTSRLRAEVSHIEAVTDSIERASASGPHGVGRFHSDSTLIRSAQRLLAHTDSLRDGIERYAGRATGRDSALARQLSRVHVQLDSLVSDAKRHPLKYIAL